MFNTIYLCLTKNQVSKYPEEPKSIKYVEALQLNNYKLIFMQTTSEVSFQILKEWTGIKAVVDENMAATFLKNGLQYSVPQ